MTRPSDITRERILKAAERLFADRGYEETLSLIHISEPTRPY